MTFRRKVGTQLHAVEDDKIVIAKTTLSQYSDHIQTAYISLPKLQIHLNAIGEHVK